jgi:aconitate hydratase
MLRGLFNNRTVKNALCPDAPPGWTVHVPTGEMLPLWRVAQRYRQDRQAVVVVAGERYGMGSSRDWAAKGLALLGVRAVLAASFERIHRTNLIGMGILPLLLPAEIDLAKLQLKPGDRLEIFAEAARLAPRTSISVTIQRLCGSTEDFATTAALDTAVEAQTLQAGGIIPLILGRFLTA